MAEYAIGSAHSTAADAGEAMVNLWNPSSSIALEVWFIQWCLANTASFLRVQRTTARGTPFSTRTPDLDNALNRRRAPASGVVLDQGNFTVNPTIDPSQLTEWIGGNASPAGQMFYYVARRRPLRVPPGTGLALVNTLATTDLRGSSFWWEE